MSLLNENTIPGGIKPADSICLRKGEDFIDRKENFVSFLRKSPLNGLNLAIKRDRSSSRVVNL